MKTKKLTVAEVLSHVEKVHSHVESGDYEAAHSREDTLYRLVLRQLAEDGNELAVAALKTSEIDFERYCA